MTDRITIVVAEERVSLRRATIRLLTSTPSLVVVGETADDEVVVHLARALSPDVVVLDIGIRKLKGMTAIRKIRQLPTPPAVVVLTMYAADNFVLEAFAAGCVGYVLKGYASQDLETAIRGAVAGRGFLSEPLRHLQPAVQQRRRP